MTEKPAISPPTTGQALKNSFGSGTLLLSSEEIGWKDLTIRVYQESLEEREGWIKPTEPDTLVMLFTRGSLYLEQRHANSPWRRHHMHQGELFLKPGGTPPTDTNSPSKEQF